MFLVYFWIGDFWDPTVDDYLHEAKRSSTVGFVFSSMQILTLVLLFFTLGNLNKVFNTNQADLELPENSYN